ncbi:MAG: cobalamin-dependent protein [Spirochaetales bacterium]|nr:cobalamin-dependent protein [Spirochaetales bacterium]
MNREIILINPGFKEKLPALNIPMGLLYVGSYLSYHHYNVSIRDVNNFSTIKDFFMELESRLNRVLCAGLSVMSSQIPSALHISNYIKTFNPSIPVIWGGVHPSLYPEQTVKSALVDFAVIGEGEITAFALINALKNGKDFLNIKGIAFINKNNNKPVITRKREYLDMDTLPPIDWSLLTDIKRIGNMAEVEKATAAGIPLQTSRGCPYRCTFCINSILKEKYRTRDVHLVLDDLEKLITIGVRRIYFRDELFFFNKKRLLTIVKGIEQRNLRFRWFGSVRSDYFKKGLLDPELLQRLKQSGCAVVGIGAESGSMRILNLLDKRIAVRDIIRAAELLNETGIQANFSFMIGLPGEEEADMKKTVHIIQKISRINNNFMVLGPQIYRPYPGSQLYRLCIKEGMKEPETLGEWGSSPYIESDIKPKNNHLYPWIKYPVVFLHNIIFYTFLLGVKSRIPFLTTIIHMIAQARCTLFFFKFPVEKKLYEFFKKIGINKLLKKMR